MSRIFNRLSASGIFLVSATLCGTAAAQVPKAGFFTLVNAVSLSTNTIVSVDGKALRPDGIKPGMVTGGLGFAEGSHRLDVANGKAKPASLQIPVAAAACPIVVIYSARRLDPSGRPADELRLFSRPHAQTTKGKQFFALYAGQAASRSVQINGRPLALKPLQEVRIGTAASASVKESSRAIDDFAPEEEGNYLIVFFDGKDNALRAVLAPDIVYQAGGPR
ncbi:MAG TPA: hypothetical protein VGF73_09065 [Chthoniobacterales bacterium]|jgi:hypothetical protein